MEKKTSSYQVRIVTLSYFFHYFKSSFADNRFVFRYNGDIIKLMFQINLLGNFVSLNSFTESFHHKMYEQSKHKDGTIATAKSKI